MKNEFNDKEKLTKLYNKYKNGYKIAEVINVNPKVLYRWLKKFGITNKNHKKRNIDDTYFEIIDTENKAYWLGFLMADGCIYKGSSKNSYRLQINLGIKDKHLLNAFLKDLKSNYEILEKTVSLQGKEHQVVMLKINSTKLCTDLMKHNVVPRKSKKCVMPPLKENLVRHFIRGYFDGDGSISYLKKRDGFNFGIVGGIEILNQFQKEFEKTSISTSIYPVRNGIFNLATTSIKSIKKIYHYMYNDSAIFLKRKHDKFLCKSPA